MVALESPPSNDHLYSARAGDVCLFERRPRFTGDVIRLNDECAMILQHPCAIRQGGLVDRLLMAKVEQHNGGVPPDWSRGHYKRFFLPNLEENGTDYVADFLQPVVWSKEDVLQGTRIALLSTHGVNLLLQRWVHHNTRVVIPTQRLNEVTAGPYEEAEIINDTCTDLVAAGGSLTRAEALVEGWLTDGHAGFNDRRSALEDPQQRAAIRQQSRAQTRMWIADGAADA